MSWSVVSGQWWGCRSSGRDRPPLDRAVVSERAAPDIRDSEPMTND